MTTVRGGRLLAVALGALLLLGCLERAGAPEKKARLSAGQRLPATRTAGERPAARSSASPSAIANGSFTVNWDPATGKGDVIQRLPDGDLLRTAFHLGYPGYTGGLIIGNYNGSGYGFYPRRPIRGFRRINVLCAQDESIWDRDEKAEYTYGWSENFGTGKDGKALAYVRGRVLSAGPDRVVLQSENAGGCYRVTKVATARADARCWIIATRITNRCDRRVRFDLFSGDDPWIGEYRSADGDVGWTAAGLVRSETALRAGQFVSGGLVDLGNQALGQTEGSFSGQANFFALDPALPLPDLALFANAFAHSPKEIHPDRPLDNKTLTALNLGWTDRTLAPGQGLTVAFALGLADTDPARPTATPRVPAITPQDWSVWRRYLKEELAGEDSEAVEFAAERVELDLRPTELQVTGTYFLRNRGSSSSAVRIQYPILSGPDRPAPERVQVDGQVLPVDPDTASSHFTVAVPARGLARFQVRYTQQHRGRHAGYMVTSARRWPAPLTRALFVIRHPVSMGPVSVSYSPDHTRRLPDGKTVEHRVLRQPFAPEHELELRWR